MHIAFYEGRFTGAQLADDENLIQVLTLAGFDGRHDGLLELLSLLLLLLERGTCVPGVNNK